MDLGHLALLLPLLRKNGVKRFKDSECEIELTPDLGELVDKLQNAPEPPDMPPDLKADDLMNADKVLNWSAPPSPGDELDKSEMPLAGDFPLSEGGEP